MGVNIEDASSVSLKMLPLVGFARVFVRMSVRVL
jgi:hypothetical protein